MPESETGLLHWHLGQIHTSNDKISEAITEMKISFTGDKTWDSYVKGTVAFLKKDKAALLNAIDTLKIQETQ